MSNRQGRRKQRDRRTIEGLERLAELARQVFGPVDTRSGMVPVPVRRPRRHD